MSEAVANGRREVEQRIQQRSSEDESFRAQLLSDPKAAVEQELGTSLPAGLQLEVVEETANKLYVVLPASSSQSGSGGELSDQDLEAVAGGWGTGGATTEASCGYGC